MQIRIRRVFVNKPMGKLFPCTRIYWRLKIHYVDGGRKNDLDIDLVNLRQHQVDSLLHALKRARPELDIPSSLDQRGLLPRFLAFLSDWATVAGGIRK